MLEAIFTNKFQKDIKRAEKRGLKMKKLNRVIKMLIDGKQLPKKYRDHALTDHRDFP